MDASGGTASIMASEDEHGVQYVTQEEEEDLELALANMTVEGNCDVNMMSGFDNSGFKQYIWYEIKSATEGSLRALFFWFLYYYPINIVTHKYEFIFPLQLNSAPVNVNK